MNKRQAEAAGYEFTGAYSWDKEEMKAAAAAERAKGNRAVTVDMAPSKLSRGYHGTGYSVYIIKSEANIAAEAVERHDRKVASLQAGIAKKKAELESLEAELLQQLSTAPQSC